MPQVNIQAWRANVFLVYTRKAIAEMDELRDRLIQLVGINYVENIWYDGLVKSYGEWGEGTVKRLQTADFIIILAEQELLHSELFQDGHFEEYLKTDPRKGRPFHIVLRIRDCEWEDTFLEKFFVVPKYGKPIRYSDHERADGVYHSVLAQIKQRILARRTEKEIKFIRDDVKIARLWEESVPEDQVILNRNIELLREQVRMQNFVIEELYRRIEEKIQGIDQLLEPELEDRRKLEKVFGKNDPAIDVLNKKIDQLYRVQREYIQLKEHFDGLIRKLGKYYNTDLLE